MLRIKWTDQARERHTFTTVIYNHSIVLQYIKIIKTLQYLSSQIKIKKKKKFHDHELQVKTFC